MSTIGHSIERTTSVKLKWTELVALFGYASLFPGFFVYNLTVFYGAPAFLGGFMVRASAAALPFLLLAYADRFRSRGAMDARDLFFSLFVGFCFLWLTIVDPGFEKEEITTGYFGVLTTWVCLYLLVRLLPLFSPIFINFNRFSFALMLVIVFANSTGALFIVGAGDLEVTYQSFAVILLFCGFLALSQTDQPLLQWLTSLALIAALFVIGARSEFVGALILISLIMTIKRGRALNIGVAIVVSIVAFSNLHLLESLETNRIRDLVYNAAYGSRFERELAMSQAVFTIFQNPFIGDYGSYTNGSYAHNVLSMWVDFGMLGFALFIGLFAMFFTKLTHKIRRQSQVAVVAHGIALLATTFLLLLTAKHFTYILVPLSLAYACTPVRHSLPVRREVL